MTSPWLQHLRLITPEKTYCGEVALQEYDRRQPTHRHADDRTEEGAEC
jgi:hypothetical protein